MKLVTEGEQEDIIYPVLSKIPITPLIAKYYLDLYNTEMKFWNHIIDCMSQHLTIDVMLYVHNYEEINLPKWIFKFGDKTLQANTKPELLYVYISPLSVTIMQNANVNTKVHLNLDVLNKDSHLYSIVKNIFPYLSLITISTINGSEQIYLP